MQRPARQENPYKVHPVFDKTARLEDLKFNHQHRMEMIVRFVRCKVGLLICRVYGAKPKWIGSNVQKGDWRTVPGSPVRGICLGQLSRDAVTGGRRDAFRAPRTGQHEFEVRKGFLIRFLSWIQL